MKWLLIVFAVVAGLVLPVQAGLNARMAKHLGHPLFATALSFLIGTLGLVLYSVIARLPTQNLQHYTKASVWEWVPGLLGAFYVAATVILVPRLGAALTFALIIAGQMVISVLLDHFGLLGLATHAITPGRAIGVLLLVIGVVLIRSF